MPRSPAYALELHPKNALTAHLVHYTATDKTGNHKGNDVIPAGAGMTSLPGRVYCRCLRGVMRALAEITVSRLWVPWAGRIGIYTTPIFGKAAYWYLFFRPKRPDCSWTSQSITA